MKSICIFCGSSPGSRPEYLEAARDLGRTLVQQGMNLVYGGGNVGMMGAVAEAAFSAGGRVTGIIPKQLAEKEVAYAELSDLRIVDSMHQRKALMEQLSDGFIAMPGGLGTIEELFEIWTWAQLNIHHKPLGLLNICGYYDRLLGFLDHIAEEQFVLPEHREMICVDENPGGLIQQFRQHQPVKIDKTKWTLKLTNNSD